MERPELVYYWFCPVCKRVYEVQCVPIPRGRWLRIFQKSDAVVPESFDGWTQIYFLTDIDTDAATEEDDKIRLSDYLENRVHVLHYISQDEKTVCVVDKSSSKVLYTYALEESWSPTEQKQ